MKPDKLTNYEHIVFLHGVTRCGRCFAPLIPHFAGYEIHAPDARGHGQSKRANAYLVRDYVPDAVAALPDSAIVYGHSMGAMAAAAAAAEAPGRVRGLILEDPPFHTMGARIEQTPLLGFFQAMRSLAGSDLPVAELAARLGDKEVPGPDLRSTIRIRDIRDAATLRFMAKCLRDLDPAVLDPIVAGEWLAGYDMDRVLAGIRCPVLLLQADPNAGGMLINEDAAKLEREIADCVRVRLPGIGHQAHWLDTAPVARYSLAFLESIR